MKNLTKTIRHMNVVKAKIAEKGVGTLNEGSYARNSAIKLIESTIGFRVKLSTHGFTMITKGRGKAKVNVITAALTTGRNISITL